MSKSNFKSNIEWLSNPKIAISIGVLAIIAALVIWFFWDKIKDVFSSIKQNKALKEKEEQNQAIYGTTTLGLDFNALASQMYKACKGWGTDESSVEAVLRQMNNNADYAALQMAYQTYDTSYTLDSRLSSEGTRRELDKWRNILIAKGISNYTF